MPQPPEVDVFTRYVLENPWPLGVGLFAIAAALVWTGLRERSSKRVMVSAIFAALGITVLVAGHMVQASGERARIVVQHLVDSVVNEDLAGADRLLADDAVLSVGSVTNPGIDKTSIMSSLSEFAADYRVEDNSITMLR